MNHFELVMKMGFLFSWKMVLKMWKQSVECKQACGVLIVKY